MTFFEDRSKNSCKNERFISMIDENEITMIPYGTKIYKILKKLGIYGK